MPWIVDVLAGLLLAVLFYALVRFRMLAAPKARDHFGAMARWSVWVLVAILMITVANLELFGLRLLLHKWFSQDSLVLHEILFATVALVVGYLLVARHVIRKPRDKNSGKGC